MITCDLFIYVVIDLVFVIYIYIYIYTVKLGYIEVQGT